MYINRYSIIFLFLIVLVLSGFGLMKKIPLSKDEKIQLSDVSVFNEKLGQNGWGIKNRIVEREILKGVKFVGSNFDNVEFRGVEFIDVVFSNVAFRFVEFVEGELVGVTLDNVLFENCTFKTTTLKNITCEKCKFVKTNFEEISGEGVNFTRSEFVKILEKDSSYLNTNIVDSKYSDSEVHSVFRGGKMHGVTFQDSILTELGFGGVDIKDVHIKGGKFETGIGGSGGGIERLTFEEVDAEAIGFKDGLVGKDIEIKSMKRLNGLGVLSGAVVDGIKIIDTKEIVGPMVKDATLKNIYISNSTVKRFVVLNSLLEGGVVVEKAVIKAMRIENSKVKGLTIKDSIVDKALYIRNSEFSGTKLDSLRIGLDTKKDIKGNKYENSDRFEDQK